MATDAGDVDGMDHASPGVRLGVSYVHTYDARLPRSSISSSVRLALLMVDSILPRCRTIPASPSSRAMSRSPNRATRTGSKLANAARKFSRLRRIVIHDRPDWK